MKTVRQQVLEYIESHRVATANEIAGTFKMTQANARNHLAVLCAEGAVEMVGVIQDGSPGRPRQRYSPTRQIQKNNLGRLSHALLKIMGEKAQEKETLENLAATLWASEDVFVPGSEREHLTRRLARVIRSLNRLNYEARWEAHAQSPRIIFNHCPYASIIADHPMLCQVDALMLQKALGVSVTQQTKLGSNGQGLTFCVFQLGGNQGYG
jgi:predicted ArsR family transcriptional regulator